MSVRFRLYLALIFITSLSILFSLFWGSRFISLSDLFLNRGAEAYTIFFQLRIPRTITAFLSGGLLSLAGVLMQVLLANPLADPYVLGISGGAAFFTLLFLLCGLGEFSLLGAWLGSLLTIGLVLLLSRKHRFNPQNLLLIGIAIACAFSAGISFILLLSPEANLRNMLFWLMGDLNDAQFPWAEVTVLSFGFVICYLLAPGLNILCRGEKQAESLGLSSQKYRCALYLLSSLFAATAVTTVGCIGFIGLIIPHLTRILFGFDHRLLLPCAMLLGGTLLTLADTFARSLLAPQQLPVGIIMAFIGVPIFIWLLQK